jgi:2'-5' RNA ligase
LFGGPERPTDRLLFALYPDGETALRIAEQRRAFQQAHGLSGPAVGVERLHMTLIHVGDFVGLPRGIVTAATYAALKISFPTFGVALDRAVSFAGQPGNSPFVLLAETSTPLMTFQETLRTGLALAGVRHKSGTQFAPHVTLLRDKVSIPEQPIDPIGWTPGEFVLVHSLLGQTRHIPLKRFALT